MDTSAVPYFDLVLPRIAALEVLQVESPRVVQEEVVPPPRSPLIAVPKVSEHLLLRLRSASELYARLDQLDAYALLGVARDATSKEVRRAYFELSKRFHPDVFFRQDIGPYRRQLDVVFDALTRAHDTLRSEQRRAEYDATLGVARLADEGKPRSSQASESKQAPGPAAKADEPITHVVAKPTPLETASERALQQRDRSLRNDSPPHGTDAPTQPRHDEGRASRPHAVPAAAPLAAPPSTDERTRDSLLRELQRLSHRAGPVSTPKRPSVTQPMRSGSPSSNPLLVLAALLHGEATGPKRWAATRLKEAHEEEKRGNVLEAASILRVVLEQVKDTRVLVQSDRLNRTSERAATTLRERARAAELEGKVREAATSWKKLAAGSPHDADAQLRAAVALLDARESQDAGPFALRAVELMPKNAAARQVLVRFFEAVGRTQSAQLARSELAKLLKAKSA